MSPFEQHIADFLATGVRHLPSCAVRGSSPGGDYLAVCNCGRDDALALRIAAAIEAGAAQTTVNIGLAVGPGVIAEALERQPPIIETADARTGNVGAVLLSDAEILGIYLLATAKPENFALRGAGGGR